MKIIFYQPVNTDKPNFVAILVFVCTTASFIAQILSSENVSKWDAVFATVAKQWISKDIPSYGSQSKRAKNNTTNTTKSNLMMKYLAACEFNTEYCAETM